MAFSADRDSSYEVLIFRRGGLRFFPDALETLNGSTGLRIERVFSCFLLRPVSLEDSLGFDAADAVISKWSRSASLGVVLDILIAFGSDHSTLPFNPFH